MTIGSGLTVALLTVLIARPSGVAGGQSTSDDRRITIEGGVARRETGDYDPWAKKSGQTLAVALEMPQSPQWSLRVGARRDLFPNADAIPPSIIYTSPVAARRDRVGSAGTAEDWNPTRGSGYNWLHAYTAEASARRYYGSGYSGFFLESAIGITVLSGPGQRSAPSDAEPVQRSYRMSPGIQAGYVLRPMSRVALSLQTGVRSTIWDLDGNGNASPTWLSEPVSIGVAVRW